MLKKPADAIVQTLKAKGMRVTPQRYAVYANLRGRADHPTVEHILNDLNQDLPLSSQATVYTSLQALQEVGLVREVLLEAGVSRYDANVLPHHHFCCDCCGDIADIPWDCLQELRLQSLPNGLYAQTYEVTVTGLCHTCHDLNAGEK